MVVEIRLTPFVVIVAGAGDLEVSHDVNEANVARGNGGPTGAAIREWEKIPARERRLSVWFSTNYWATSLRFFRTSRRTIPHVAIPSTRSEDAVRTWPLGHRGMIA